MRKIAYRPRAMADLERILVYLAVESQAPQAARQAAAKIIDAIEPAAQNPTMGRKVEDDRLEQSYRRVLSGCYWVYYTYDEKALTAWRIFHTSRDTESFGFLTLGS